MTEATAGASSSTVTVTDDSFSDDVLSSSTPVLVVAVIMAINAAIGAVVYLSIIGRMFQSDAAAQNARVHSRGRDRDPPRRKAGS